MGTVNLHTTYKQPLVEAFEHSSILAGKTTEEFDWRGNNAIVLTDIETDPLNDYDRTNSSNRYGTPSEVKDNQQVLTLQKDRSFSKTVDKGNYQEANYLKKGVKVVKAYMNEQVSPEMEQYALNQFAQNAGTIYGEANAPAANTALGMLLNLEVKLNNARAPRNNRFVAVKNDYIPFIKTSLTDCDTITDKWVRKGLIGRIGTLNILETVSSDMPADCWMLAWQKRCVANPKTIEDTKISKDVPGISGMLVEARFRYGAFVVGKRAGGVIALIDSSKQCATPAATKGATTTALASATNGASIKYTVDGSDPRYSKTAEIYASAITNPAAGVVIKAAAYRSGMYWSAVLSHTCV